MPSTVVFEKTPESPLDSKQIKPVNFKGDQGWLFPERTAADAEVTVFWSSGVNRGLMGKVPDAGKDQGLKEKRASEDEMAGQHHQYNEHEQSCANSRRWWGAGRPGMLQSMGLGKVRHDWVTAQQKYSPMTLWAQNLLTTSAWQSSYVPCIK